MIGAVRRTNRNPSAICSMAVASRETKRRGPSFISSKPTMHGDIADCICEKTPAFANPRHQQACDGRANYARAIEHGRIQRDRVHQVLAADHVDQKRLPRRNVECIHRAKQGRQYDDFPDAHDVRERENCEDERKNHRRNLRADDDAMAIPAVGGHAADGGEQKYGDLPSEANRSQEAATILSGDKPARPGRCSASRCR